MNLWYTDRAILDLEIAIDWYERQVAGLGLQFLDCIEEKISLILKNPQSYPLHHKNFRRALIRKFPFAIFYSIEKSSIVLHAIFDNRQSPAHLP